MTSTPSIKKSPVGEYETPKSGVVSSSIEDGEKQQRNPVIEAEAEAQNESPALQRWNHPRINIYRYLATLLSFINMGMVPLIVFPYHI